MDSIGAQLWLLGYDIGRGAPPGGRHVAYAVSAGLLAELVLSGRLGGTDHCEVIHSDLTASPAANELLARIAADRPRPWEDWIKGSSRTAVVRVAAELEDRCRVVRYERRVAHVLIVRRHALLDPAGVERLRAAAAEALAGTPGAVVEPRLGVVAALAATGGLLDVTSSTEKEGNASDRVVRLGAPVAMVQRSLATAMRLLAIDVSALRLSAWI